MIIDFHTHVYPEAIAAKAVAHTGAYYGLPLRGAGTVSELRALGEASGVGLFVLLPVAETPAQVANANTFVAQVCSGGACFAGFGALHPDMPDAGAEIRRITGLGLKGVKFHPDLLRVAIDDERMRALYALLEGRLPVIFHVGDFRTTYSHPARLARIIAEFPRLTVIAAHMGGWSVFDLALEYLLETNCYLDLSSAIDSIGKRRMEELIALYGPRRVLFASDYPMYLPGEELAKFNSLNLDACARELILYKNAQKILCL